MRVASITAGIGTVRGDGSTMITSGIVTGKAVIGTATTMIIMTIIGGKQRSQ